MPDGSLNAEARHENVRALAVAAGLSQEEASARLDVAVLITHDVHSPVANALVAELVPILTRTLAVTFHPGQLAPRYVAELVIGNSVPRSFVSKVFVALLADRVVIGPRPTGLSGSVLPHPLMVLLAACYVSGSVINAAVGGGTPNPPSSDIEIPFDAFLPRSADLTDPIECGEAFLAGAGAIGNGLLWAARHVHLVGKLNIVDDDIISPGNLQRQVWFDFHDIAKPKAARLAELAQPFVPHYALVPAVCRLQDHPARSDGAWLPQLIVAVDSRGARRHLQYELPGQVFDASTTGSQEIVLHYNKQPTDYACLGCVYHRDEVEVTHEQAVADHLGIDVESVCRPRVNQDDAQRICEKHPQLSSTEIEGLPFDTLYKQLCGSAQLKSVSGKQVIAPFAFVSVLAGTLLLLEIIRRRRGIDSGPESNEWRVNPWMPPVPQLRYLRPRQEGCEICGRIELRLMNEKFWSGGA